MLKSNDRRSGNDYRRQNESGNGDKQARLDAIKRGNECAWCRTNWPCTIGHDVVADTRPSSFVQRLNW